MENQKFNLILDKLLEKTEEGKLEWEKTANRNTFLVVLEDSSISVSLNFDSVFEFISPIEIYTFDFRNGNGDIVESIDISNPDVTVKPAREFEKAKKIFALARNQPIKVDQTVDRILEQLAA